MQTFRALRLPSRTVTSLSKRQNARSISQPKPTRTISTSLRPSPWSVLPKGATPNRRAFGLPSLSSLLPSNGNNGNSSPHRVLTATRDLPYNPALLYKVIASVESYSEFLPFLTASTVTARDPKTGYPTQAFLTVGYGPLSETFTSRVDCDVEKLTVQARSGDKYEKENQGNQSGNSSSGLGGLFPGSNEGLFEYLSTKWELVPLTPAGAQGGPMTKVGLEVRFAFRSQMHATIMSTVEGQMAGVMIEAFEKRIREVEGKGL